MGQINEKEIIATLWKKLARRKIGDVKDRFGATEIKRSGASGSGGLSFLKHWGFEHEGHRITLWVNDTNRITAVGANLPKA